jgi:phytoene synthase
MTVSLDESFTYCKSLARRTAGNFYFSFLTLPSDRFRDMCALYAFMRVSDDLGDDDQLPTDQRAENLRRWRTSLETALGKSQFDHPVLPALTEIVRRHEIPHEYLFAVLDGVSADLKPGGFETFDELSDYCYHVAGAVGLCCIHVWGFRRDPGAVEAAINCGLALQLTNILRDLAEDAGMGRIYLPREDLNRFGYSEEDIRQHRLSTEFSNLMRFEVERAKAYYSRGEKLFDYLEPCGRPILAAMLQIYGGLLTKIERRNYDVFDHRVRLTRGRKLWIATKAIARHRWWAGNRIRRAVRGRM